MPRQERGKCPTCEANVYYTGKEVPEDLADGEEALCKQWVCEGDDLQGGCGRRGWEVCRVIFDHHEVDEEADR